MCITRTRPPRQLRPLEILLEGLGEDGFSLACKLLKRFGRGSTASHEDIQQVVSAVEAHPLAIELAMRLLADGANAEEIVREVKTIDGDHEELSQRLLGHILDGRSSPPRQRELMIAFSAFRGRVSRHAISEVLSDLHKRADLVDLVDKLMLYRDGDIYWTHPLIRAFCYERLINRQGLHRRIAAYFQGSGSPVDIDALLGPTIIGSPAMPSTRLGSSLRARVGGSRGAALDLSCGRGLTR